MTFIVKYLDTKNKPRELQVVAASKYRVNKKFYQTVGYKAWIISVSEVVQ